MNLITSRKDLRERSCW